MTACHMSPIPRSRSWTKCPRRCYALVHACLNGRYQRLDPRLPKPHLPATSKLGWPLDLKTAVNCRVPHTPFLVARSRRPAPSSPPPPTHPSPSPPSRFPYVPLYRTPLHSMAPLAHEVEPSTMVRRRLSARRHPVPAISCG